MKIESVCGVFTVEYTYFKFQNILLEAKYVVEHKSGEGGTYLFEQGKLTNARTTMTILGPTGPPPLDKNILMISYLHL